MTMLDDIERRLDQLEAKCGRDTARNHMRSWLGIEILHARRITPPTHRDGETRRLMCTCVIARLMERPAATMPT